MLLIGVLCLIGTASAAYPTKAQITTANKCASPMADLVTRSTAFLSTLLSASGFNTVAKLLMTQCCQGDTIEAVGSNFINTMSKGADSASVKTISSKMLSFTTCLLGCGSNLNKAFSDIGVGFKSGIGPLYTKGQTKAKNSGATCNSTALYNVLAKYTCPLLNRTTVQTVITATKAQMGTKCWSCVVSNVNPGILNLTGYTS